MGRLPSLNTTFKQNFTLDGYGSLASISLGELSFGEFNINPNDLYTKVSALFK